MLRVKIWNLCPFQSEGSKLKFSHLYWLRIDGLLMYYMIPGLESVQEEELGFEVERL